MTFFSRTINVRRIFVVLILPLLLPACDSRKEEPQVSYREARNELARYVDEAVRASLDTANPPPGAFGRDSRCFESDGSYSDTKFSSVYDVQFPVELLGNDPERLLRNANQVWRSAGFQIENDERTTGVNHVFGSGRGFALQATLNNNSGMAHIGGSGPCTHRPANENS